MRDFVTFTITDEMPAHMNRQIEIPEFMLSQDEPEIKESVIPNIIQFIALSGIVYFGILTETHLAAGLIGLAVSIITANSATIISHPAARNTVLTKRQRSTDLCSTFTPYRRWTNCIITTNGSREILIWNRKKAGRPAAASATSSMIKFSQM